MSKQFYDEALIEQRLDQMLSIIKAEVLKAAKKHPAWPVDLIHRVMVVAEEAGELNRAALQVEYEDGNLSEVWKEAIQTGAMCARLLCSLNLGGIPEGGIAFERKESPRG